MKKKDVLTNAGLALCIILGCSTSFADDVQFTKTFSFSSSDIAFQKDRGFDAVKILIKGSDRLVEIGKPDLPCRHLFLIVPDHMKVKSFTMVANEVETLSGEFNIIPTQKPRYSPDSTPWVPPDSVTYRSETPYPGKGIDYLGKTYLREANVISVRLFPFQWVPKTQKFILSKRMTISLVLSIDPIGPIVVERRSKKSQFEFVRFLQRYVE